MADETTNPQDVVEIKPEPPPKPKKEEPKATFFGVTADQMPEHLRPTFNEYASVKKDVEQRQAIRAENELPTLDPKTVRATRLEEIRAQLPGEKTREEMNKALHHRRTFKDFGFGQTLLDDQAKRMGIILEERGIEDNAESRQKLLNDLVSSARDQVPYDASNPLFDATNDNYVNYHAAEVLQTWAMQNLHTKFDSPTDLYNNFGKVLKEQEALKNEAAELIRQKTQDAQVENIAYAIMNGKKVAAIPKYDKGTNQNLRDAADNELLRFMYGDNTSHDLLDMYAKGMSKGQDPDDVLAIMGNKPDAERVLKNAFYVEEKALPSELYVPVHSTRDNRFAINVKELQGGIENYLFRQEADALGLKPSELSTEQRDNIRKRVRDRTAVMTNNYLDPKTLVMHKDPDGTLRKFIEGEGMRADAYNVLRHLNTVITAGQKEKILNNLPDRVARSLVALTLPRRAAGIIARGDEQLDFARGGEFFVPGFGDTGVSNKLDYILRLAADEVITKSFALAVDDEAKENNDSEGRPMRVAKKMLENIGTDRHIGFMVKDEHSGGRFLTEFGDAFINPMLGDFGKEHPQVGTVIGGLAALATFIFSPDAFTAAAVGTAGVRAGKLKGLTKAGMTDQTQIAKGGTALEKVIQNALDAHVGKGATRVTTEEQFEKVAAYIDEAVRRDETGALASINVLTLMQETFDHNIATSMRGGGAIAPLLKYYERSKERVTKYKQKADEEFEKVSGDLDDAQNMRHQLAGLSNEIHAINEVLNAEQAVHSGLTAFRKNKSLTKRFLGKLVGYDSKKIFSAQELDFLNDAFVALRDPTAQNLAKLRGAHKNMFDWVPVKKGDPDILPMSVVNAKVREILSKTYGNVYRKGSKLTDAQSELLSPLREVANFDRVHLLGQLKGLKKTVKTLRKQHADVDSALKGLGKSKAMPTGQVAVALNRVLNDNIVRVKELTDRIRVLERSAEEAGQKASKFTDQQEALESGAFVVDSFNDYLTGLKMNAAAARKIGSLKPETFNRVMKATTGRDRTVFAQEFRTGVEKGKAKGREGTGMTQKELDNLQKQLADTDSYDALGQPVADDIFRTRYLVNLFSDPKGTIQLDHRSLQRVLTSPRALKTYATVELNKHLEKFPFFQTNIRHLEIPVSREIDFAAKKVARRNQEITDGFDLVYDNMADVNEAHKVVVDMLTSPSKLFEVESRYKLPFLPKARIALTGIVGRENSLAKTFLMAVQDQRRITKAAKAGGDEALGYAAIDSAIKAFISDLSVLRRDEILDPEGAYLLARGRILKELDENYTDLIESTPDVMLSRMEGIIRKHLVIGDGKNQKIAVVSDNDLIRTADARSKFYKSIVLGAGQFDLMQDVAMIVGPRFNTNMGRVMNYMMGLGAEATTQRITRDFKEGDYVVFMSDVLNENAIVNKVKNIGTQSATPFAFVTPKASQQLKARDQAEMSQTLEALQRDPDNLIPFNEANSAITDDIVPKRFVPFTGFAKLDEDSTRYGSRSDVEGFLDAKVVLDWISKNAIAEEHRKMATFLRDRMPEGIGVGGEQKLKYDPEKFASRVEFEKAQKEFAKKEIGEPDWDELPWQTKNKWMAENMVPVGYPETSAFWSGSSQMIAVSPKYTNVAAILHEAQHALAGAGYGLSISDTVRKDFHKHFVRITDPLFLSGNTVGILSKQGKDIFAKMGLTPRQIERVKDRISYIRRNKNELDTVLYEGPTIRAVLSALPAPYQADVTARKVVEDSSLSPKGFEGNFYDALSNAQFERLYPDLPTDLKTLFRDATRLGSANLAVIGRKPVAKAADIDNFIKGRGGVDIEREKKAGPIADLDRPPSEPVTKNIYRLGKFEEAQIGSAYRINKIETAPDGTQRIYLNRGNKEGNLIVTPSEITHRDISMSVLDGLDGFAIYGMEAVGNIGLREKMSGELVQTRSGFQKMVVGSVDPISGEVLMVPHALFDNVVESLTKIEKVVDEAYSKKVAETTISARGLDMFAKFVRFFKTHILTGLWVPRPAYFMNQNFGDYTQMMIRVGPVRATSLSFMGALGYLPFYGSAAQEAYIQMVARMPPGKKALPPAMSALFNDVVDKVMRNTDEMLTMPNGQQIKASTLHAQARDAGVGESIRTQDFSVATKKVLQRQRDENPTLFQRLEKAGQDMQYMQKVMELKIREATRRQRLLYYLDARFNRGMSEQEAAMELADTLYDWTHSVGKHEMQMIGRLVLFYTLSKNAIAQVFRMFTEGADVGLKEYGKRYARGETQLQRFELITRLMTQFPALETRPFEELEGAESRERATMMNLPSYLAEYPLLDLNALSPAALEIMSEGGFIRSNYARVLPKATATEYMLSMMDITGSLMALAVSGANIVDPEGNVIPFSADAGKSAAALSEAIVDQYLVPVYGDMYEGLARSFTNMDSDPKSQYGRRFRPGDMATIELLGKLGLADTFALLTDDPKDKRVKRIKYHGGPIVDAVVRVPQTEFHRFRLGLALIFPGMAPAEIRALAANDPQASARLEALKALVNLDKAVFYNGADERYFELDEIRDRFSEQRNRLKRKNNSTLIVGDGGNDEP